MLARDEVVNLLAAHLPEGIEVIPYARNIDPPSVPTVMVRIDRVRPSQIAGSLWDVDVALILIATQVTPGPADIELDGLLQDVLFALGKTDIQNAIRWTEATRAVFGEPEPTNPAYEVMANTQVQKES